MARRTTKNTTGIARIEGVRANDAWVGFVCVNCGQLTTICIGEHLLTPEQAFSDCRWSCSHCQFVHAKDSSLPAWENWSDEALAAGSLPSQRFWQGFFRIHAENPAAYWKRCNVCGHVLPFSAFSKHTGWGPLEKQMECRSCKGAINAVLNPLRTKEQMHESAARRRAAQLLMDGQDERLSFEDLFKRFNGRCFKTKQPLDIKKRGSWQIDHILPATYLYPLTRENACLLSSEANQAKKSAWPGKYYSASELVELARLTGADLELLSHKEPVVNTKIDVDACVSRYLKVRERSNLTKRVKELKDLLEDYGLVSRLSKSNRKLLGYE
jgi:hypothetical protein